MGAYHGDSTLPTLWDAIVELTPHIAVFDQDRPGSA